jgi:predicted nucleic acid-binding protein
VAEGIGRSTGETLAPPFLDTSVIVRYMIGDVPDQALQAISVIDSPFPVSLSAVVIAEVAHVIRSFYGVPRELVVDGLIELVQRENVLPYGLDRATLVEALRLCRPSGRVSIPDALVWAEARTSGAKAVYSFDRAFPRIGIEVRETA